MKQIFAIHGAFSSPRIFSYLRLKLGGVYHWNYLDYSAETGGITNILAKIPSCPKPHHVIGHSMGGIMALSLINQPWVCSVSTISTPLGGLDVNLFQSLLSRSNFMQELSSQGDIIRDISKIKSSKPVQHLVSTRGFHPWLYEPNDGVITLRSQRAIMLGPMHDIAANHSEIMMSDETVDILQRFWR